jgi:putative membrane protein
VTTLVLSVDRGGSPGAAPLVGDAAVESLITEAGVADPEDSRVNCYLETLRVARELRGDGDEAVPAVVASDGDAVTVDREIARQVDRLVAEYEPDSAIIVVDSAEDERAVPIVESRVRVDAVDRVVVRQARDIESTYYLLKQFLADEELRATVLVPVGAALLSLPILLALTDSIAVTAAVVTAVVGTFLLYKGLGIDDLLAGLPRAVRDAFYSGQVSLVTYVVGAGLALVGVFAGVIALSGADASAFLQGMLFVHRGVPWFALAALAAATGRLFDRILTAEELRSSLLNLPFGVVAIGLVVRGFAGFFLENAGLIGPLRIPSLDAGAVVVRAFVLASGTRLAAFVAAGILVSLLGVGVSSYMRGMAVDGRMPPESE